MQAAEQLRAPTSITEYAPGIHAGIPAALYHRRELGVVSKGALDQIARTPAHYRAWANGASEEETPALTFGRALHALCFEPDAFAKEWAAQPNFGDLRTKAAKAARDEWLAAHPGVTTVSAEDWERLHRMADAIMSHPIAGALFSGGQPEATAIWTDPGTGLLCKSRMDYWRPDIGVIGDLKSTEDASPEAFARSVARYRYHVQQAHYEQGVIAHGYEAPTFVFVAVEKSEPHAVAVYQLDDEATDRGYELRSRDISTLNACLRTDEWPAYPPKVNTLTLPAWALRD